MNLQAQTNTNIETAAATRMLFIATANSRTSTRWKNRQMSWEELLERFREPTRTQETFSEYKAMTKTQQGNVKDVGGFVAGALKDGRRKAENVQFRTALTLDLDQLKESPRSFWEGLEMFHNFEAAAYTTHSHSPKTPRLRLVIPLSRNVSPDEYEAIARKIAGYLGMDNFDQTTFEPSRLMYWPSAARDAEYLFLHQEGPWLDPDEVLNQYIDWRDTSFWPGLDRFHERLLGQLKKQEDPLEKKGLIGAYCRTYTIADVIATELSDIYTPTKVKDRYTYSEGSTEGGLVIYDDKFAYSHHNTDPISGRLVNAFDLLRIHKFGAMDDDAKEGTPVGRLPSFRAMEEWVQSDNQVKARFIQEQRGIIEEELTFEDPETDWTLKLDLQNNKIASTVNNCQLILENDEKLKGRYYYDEFRGRAIVMKDLPWQKGKDRDWNDTDDAGYRNYLEKIYGITGVQKIVDGVALAFENNKRHPIRDYLSSLTWDGVERVESAIINYLGAFDTPYVRTVTRMHLVAAVARVMRPGVKYDTMLTLVGPQGIGKTSFVRILCGAIWFNDSIERIAGKETFELLQGSWHVELGELNATRRAEKEAVKQFLSKTEDIYRAPYGRRTIRHPRQCIFWGTGNEQEFLRDDTGDRRYLPVKCGELEPTKEVFRDLEEERDQIWAEAVHLYQQGHPLHLSREEEAVANAVRLQHKEDRPKVGLIQEFLEKEIPVTWYRMTLPERLNYLRGYDEEQILFGTEEETMRRDKVCVFEVWCELFERRRGELRNIDSQEIRNILSNLEGWEIAPNPLRFGEYGRQRGYVRVATEPGNSEE